MSDYASNEENDITEYVGWKKKTALFLSSQCISVFGSTVVSYAIMWYLVLKTASGAMMSLYVLSSFLPNLLSAPFAGVLADRFDRKKLIITVDASLALFTLAVAIVFVCGYQPIWLFVFTAFVRSMLGGLHSPSVNAVLPQIVPSEKLMKVNGLFSSLQSVMYFAAPAAGGLILSLSNITVCFLVDVISAAIGIAILICTHIPPHEKALEGVKGGYFADMKTGVRYILSDGFLKALLIFYGIECILIAPVSFLSPLFITRSFGGEVWMLSVNEVVYSIGSMVGGLVLAWWGGFKNKTYMLVLSTVIMGAFIAALGYSPYVYAFFVLMALVGLCVPWFYSSVTSIIQQKVSRDVMGRVFAVVAAIGSATVPLGMVLFGPLADYVSITTIFLVSGALTLLLGIGIWRTIRKDEK